LGEAPENSGEFTKSGVGKALLVFSFCPTTILVVKKPWYQRWFNAGVASDRESTQARAEQGDAQAQFNLGLQFANGPEEARDYTHAARWYLKAAEQSHALAQFHLATMYAAGQGVPRDDAQATIWFQKAAAQGDAGAQYHLGMRHQRASIGGSPEEAVESRVEAFKWFQLAAAQGYRGSATACERVTQHMTRADVTDGNERAAKFLAERTNACEPH
jgi:TPR repeat protein